MALASPCSSQAFRLRCAAGFATVTSRGHGLFFPFQIRHRPRGLDVALRQEAREKRTEKGEKVPCRRKMLSKKKNEAREKKGFASILSRLAGLCNTATALGPVSTYFCSRALSLSFPLSTIYLSCIRLRSFFDVRNGSPCGPALRVQGAPHQSRAWNPSCLFNMERGRHIIQLPCHALCVHCQGRTAVDGHDDEEEHGRAGRLNARNCSNGLLNACRLQCTAVECKPVHAFVFFF